MIKKLVLSTFVIFLLWTALDFVMHGMVLSSHYQATANLWRPMPEMNMSLVWSITLVHAFLFSAIYAWLISPKSMKRALIYGLIFGVATGLKFGYGSYAVMPIAHFMAFVWFLGTIIEALIASTILGIVFKEPLG
ncbi:MAG: hypothetical protein IPJ88_05810 [Myxococcales bacterium]|nr:MAG: hypothetical protein IPJ88_05810 [Myxococcales bacterium]